MWLSGAWNSSQTWRNILLSSFRNKNFKREIENTARFTRLKTCFADSTMEAYVVFVAFVAQDFEAFLLPLESKDPMIHLLYPAMLSSLCSPKKIHRWGKIVSWGSWRKYQNKCQCWKDCQTYSYDLCGKQAKTMLRTWFQMKVRKNPEKGVQNSFKGLSPICNKNYLLMLIYWGILNS